MLKTVIYNDMPSPQKKKGSSFEREVANFLTEIYQESLQLACPKKQTNISAYEVNQK